MKFESVALYLSIAVCGGAATCHAGGFEPVGPRKTAAVEAAMYEFNATGLYGFWPRDEFFRKSRKAKLKEERVKHIEGWYARVLTTKVQPEDNQWNSDNWRIGPKYPLHRDYLLGSFGSRDKRISQIRCQMRERSRNMALTIHSDQLFPNKNFTGKEVRDLLREVLNFPEDVQDHMQVMSESVVIDGVAVTYGKAYDARHKNPMTTERVKKYIPRKEESSSSGNPAALPARPGSQTRSKHIPLIPEKEREWYSPMWFSIFAGRLSVYFSTMDWKSGERPMEI